jgi:hypothetical protein
MIFLIEYNQRKGEIVRSLPFQDSQRREAENARLQTELDLNRQKIEHEVVLLEAESEDAMRKTHRRYFEGLRRMLELGADSKAREGWHCDH